MATQQTSRQFMELLLELPYLQGIVRDERKDAPDLQFEGSIQFGQSNFDLLFRRGNNVPGFGHYLPSGPFPGLLGTRDEYYIPLLTGDRLGEPRTWSTEHGDSHFVRDLFHAKPPVAMDWDSSADPFRQIRAIIWVRSERWYEDIDMRDRVGELKRQRLFITVYREPKQGWRQLYRWADPLRNVRLSGQGLFEGRNFGGHFQRVLLDLFSRVAMGFEDEVWQQGLARIVADTPRKKMVGSIGNVRVEVLTLAGSIMIGFHRHTTSFWLKGLDAATPFFGFSSIEGRALRAERLVEDVIRVWSKANPAQRQSFLTESTTFP